MKTDEFGNSVVEGTIEDIYDCGRRDMFDQRGRVTRVNQYDINIRLFNGDSVCSLLTCLPFDLRKNGDLIAAPVKVIYLGYRILAILPLEA